MNTFTIAIGRNIGGDEMDPLKWDGFNCQVAACINSDPFLTIEYVVNGTAVSGEWGVEETAVFGGSIVARPDGRFDLSSITYKHLSDLAEQYGQDAIAVTIGKTVFAEPGGINLGGYA